MWQWHVPHRFRANSASSLLDHWGKHAPTSRSAESSYV
ncbi:hypothetical protein Z947_3965 [Sulfitobacter geojensis]|nr:hypothetical protein Z947_3965 [Sulfitobacter geojensis]